VGLTGEGYRAFVEAEMPRLYRIAFALTGKRDEAWDLTQDALVRVGLRWKHVDAEGNPYGYAATTVVRLHLNHVRRSGREWLAIQRFGKLREPTPVVGAFDLSSLEPWLESALRGLSRRQRAALVLRYVADQCVDEVAVALGCSVATAKTHLQRGLANLRAQAPTEEAPMDEVPMGDSTRQGAGHER